MGRLRLYLITALAFLLEVLVLLWFPVAGVRPRVLPPLVCLVGVCLLYTSPSPRD